LKCKHCGNEKAKFPACSGCGCVLELRDRVDEIRFSYSGISTFETCKHAWYLTYIKEEERLPNTWAEYGLLVHETLEKYFNGELEASQLAKYYIDNWDKFVVTPPPQYIMKISEYKEQGLKFFEGFVFDKNNYNVILIEGKVDIEYQGIKIVVKPDLILQDKETGKYYLLDYKSSLVWKKGKFDEEKWSGYKKQMSLYSAFCGYDIHEVWVWFLRDEEREFEKFKPNKKDFTSIKKWISNNVSKISDETKFEPTINPFFCKNLCSVKNKCKYIKEI